MAPVACAAPAQLGAAFLLALRNVPAHLVHLMQHMALTYLSTLRNALQNCLVQSDFTSENCVLRCKRVGVGIAAGGAAPVKPYPTPAPSALQPYQAPAAPAPAPQPPAPEPIRWTQVRQRRNIRSRDTLG